ncbi:hypothetical protein HS088_TW12G00552 [Tripterygium wilfordii]|uniref:Myb/SANT-like domain-containing protein n=2 Tax=Tripterygium wilfordii TaxID=458696 RepID=A0A7J7CZ12_TRIWF|nr:hypothetical protein HS088_TW12G00552 [Tripterygium wilfordii]
MDGEASQQHKPERSRMRWTASLDKIFADLVVKQIQLGNRPNNIFDKKTWNHIREEFNKQTDLNFNNNQLRKHLDVLRTRFNNLKTAFVQNDFAMDDSCFLGFDLWDDIAAQARSETIKVKDCPIYDQLCTIFTDTSAEGKYAQSSHFEGMDKAVCDDTVGLNPSLEGETTRSEDPSLPKEKVAKNLAERKRKRAESHTSLSESVINQETIEAMGKAMMEMVAASKSTTTVATKPSDEKFSITNCIKALDAIEGIDQQLYFAALDLFEDPNSRETFISLQGNDIRLPWLQGKIGKSAAAYK